MSFHDTLTHHIQHHNSLLCVGLDPDPARIPAHLGSGATAVYAFCRDIIAATQDVVAAFKPNIAFFEAMGPAGIEVLAQLMSLPRHNLWILDAKRGDIGNTASAYASAAFDQFHADAITVSPYLGGDALEPFLARPDRGAFILCRTSNPGSRDLQELQLADGRPLYAAVATLAQHDWNKHRNVGLVVGATQPAALAEVRQLCPDLPLLLPGIGAQGGDLAQALHAGLNAHRAGLLINTSRSVLYASTGPDFAQAARTEALRTQAAINAIRFA